MVNTKASAHRGPYCPRCKTVVTGNLKRHDSGYHQMTTTVTFRKGGRVLLERNSRTKQFHCLNCSYANIYPFSLQRHGANCKGKAPKANKARVKADRAQLEKRKKVDTPEASEPDEVLAEAEEVEELPSERDDASDSEDMLNLFDADALDIVPIMFKEEESSEGHRPPPHSPPPDKISSGVADHDVDAFDLDGMDLQYPELDGHTSD